MLLLVVIAYAKILILKQVTTVLPSLPDEVSCYCLCKDTNSQASHNGERRKRRKVPVVIAYAKILILKQVTTTGPRAPRSRSLLLPMQRY